MINKLKFSIDIETKPSEVWRALWKDENYRSWASVFYEGSYVVCDDWCEGGMVKFLGPDQNGIYSLIEKYTINKVVQFKHIGAVLKGEKQAVDEETKKWSGAQERYELVEGEKQTTLNVALDVMDEHLEFMTATFPKALEKVRTMALAGD